MAGNFHGQLVAFLVASFATSLVHADIPVHCVQPDIVGLWRFHVGTFQGANGLDSQCGYTAPDGPDGHHELTPPNVQSNPAEGNYYLTDKFKKAFSMEVLLRDWNSKVISVDAAGKQHFPEDVEKMTGGQWTMIYDEGFHVNVGGGKEGEHSFLAFSKYMLPKGGGGGSTDSFGNKKFSFCENTLLGWYRQIDHSTGAITKQQCWWGEKIKSLHEALATLPPALAGMPPVLPLPLNTSATSKTMKPPKNKPSQFDLGSGGTPFLPRGATEDDFQNAAKVLPGGLSTDGSHYQLFKRFMQALLIVSLATAVFAAWTAQKSAGTGSGSEKGRMNWWHVVALCCLIISCIIIGVLWFGQSSAARQQLPLSEKRLVRHSVNAAGVASHRHRRSFANNTTVSDAADRLHEDLEEARQTGVAVHWQSNPEKFKKWLQERREKHGMNIHETSTVQELLDAVSPPRHFVGMGFASDQVIGPARAVAIKEQVEIAKKLGKSPSELTTQDVKDGWITSETNHHKQREFSMNGQALAPEGWQTLTDFDWRSVSLKMPGGKSISNFVQAVPDQGGCGSCYAVAATSMITSRLMLKYPELHEKFAEKRGGDRISVAQQLNCNPFNQGCDGGYPYLTSAWSAANDLVSDKCMGNTIKTRKNGTSEQCPRKFEGAGCEERFRVSKWSYIGGALGRCGLHHLCEDAMREELYKGGPMAVSVEPTAGFGYADGVYHGVSGMEDKNLLSDIPKKDNADCQGSECYIWRKVDHSVLLVGWGEDTTKGKSCTQRVHRAAETEVMPDVGCEKIENEQDCGKKAGCVYRGFPYWIIQNSYGTGFGREGYLYFGPRGQDPMRVESMTLAADVEWVNRPAGDKLADAGGERAGLLQTSSVLSPAKKHRSFGRIKDQ